MKKQAFSCRQGDVFLEPEMSRMPWTEPQHKPEREVCYRAIFRRFRCAVLRAFATIALCLAGVAVMLFVMS